MGMAGPQLLAEEMTAELKAQRAEAIEDARLNRWGKATVKLSSKGINFGALTVIRLGTASNRSMYTFDNSRLSGIDSDLVVKPFQWKGTTRFVREFSRGAAHTEMGMQPDEPCP